MVRRVCLVRSHPERRNQFWGELHLGCKGYLSFLARQLTSQAWREDSWKFHFRTLPDSTYILEIRFQIPFYSSSLKGRIELVLKNRITRLTMISRFDFVRALFR